MTDLSSPEIQAQLKKLQRSSLLTNVLMCVLTALAIAITVWASLTGRWERGDWAQILFFILVGAIVVLFVIILSLEFNLRKSSTLALRAFVAEQFKSGAGLLTAAGDARFELLIGGDKLTLLRDGVSGMVQFDLAPIKNFTSACAAVHRYVRCYLYDYYFAAAIRPQSATLCDAVTKSRKIYALVVNGQPAKDRAGSYNLKNGLI